MGFLVLCIVGCGKQEETPAARQEAKVVNPASPDAYMKDPAFRKELKDRRKVAQQIGESREKVTARQEEMVKAAGVKLKTDDRSKIVASLAGNAEWRALEEEAKKLDEMFRKHHNETLCIVRERIVPKGKKISK